VLATEIKKVFSNELTGENFPKRIKEIQGTLKQAIINNSYFFSQEHTKWKSGKVLNLLDQKMDPAIYLVDKKLLDLLQNFELLAFVNPRNTSTELIKFSKSKYTELPKFKYAPIKINPFELKQKLSLLRTQDISDITIRNLYESVINSYFDKIDLLAALGTKSFSTIPCDTLVDLVKKTYLMQSIYFIYLRFRLNLREGLIYRFRIP